MKKSNNNSSNFINLGTFNSSEAEILESELEKRGIPVKISYPGTNIGKEATAHARWTAYTLSIRKKDSKQATEICKKLNLEPQRKISLPPSLYNNLSRYLLFIMLFAFVSLLLLGILDMERIGGTFLPGIIIIVIIVDIFAWLGVVAYRKIKS